MRLQELIEVSIPNGDVNMVNHSDDWNSVNESGNRLAGLLTPKKRKEMGRPTTSREKAPYEGLSKRTRFCTICRRQGQGLAARIAVTFRSLLVGMVGARTVGVEGHRRNTCRKVSDLRLSSMGGGGMNYGAC